MNQSIYSETATPDVLAIGPRELRGIERLVRIPVLIFFCSAIFWLMVSSCLGLLASTECHSPHSPAVLSNIPWLTFGRVFPAFQNALVYGWLSAAGIGVAIWLLSRLCNTAPRTAYLPVLSAVTWNIGVGAGIISILGGAGNGRELLDFPFYAAFLLLLAFLFVGIWAVLVIWNRESGSIYISEWYIFAALLCFAWSFATANVLLNLSQSSIGPAPGVSQGAILAWHQKGLFGLWLAPIALAAAYYFIPKFAGRPIYSHKLALLGFWGWIPCVALGGLTMFLGGPFPAWMITLGIVATVLAIIPVLAVAVNFHMTMRSCDDEVRGSTLVFRFVTLGAMMYTFYGFEAAANSLRSIGQFTEFTLVVLGQNHLFLYGFCSLILFGVLNYLLPRLLNRRIIFEGLAHFHFWTTIVGFGLLWFDLTIGGLIQGFGLQDAKVSMDSIGDLLRPFLMVQAVGALIIFVANAAFAISMALVVMLPDRARNRPDFSRSSLEETSEVTVA
jgi:cytochrome c oxidase cbb3-type subunit I